MYRRYGVFIFVVLVMVLRFPDTAVAKDWSSWLKIFHAYHYAEAVCKMTFGENDLDATEKEDLKHWCAIVQHPVDALQDTEWWEANAPRILQREQTTWLCLLEGKLPSTCAALLSEKKHKEEGDSVVRLFPKERSPFESTLDCDGCWRHLIDPDVIAAIKPLAKFDLGRFIRRDERYTYPQFTFDVDPLSTAEIKPMPPLTMPLPAKTDDFDMFPLLRSMKPQATKIDLDDRTMQPRATGVKIKSLSPHRTLRRTAARGAGRRYPGSRQ